VPDRPNDPAVSNVELVDFDGDGTLDVLGTEMRQGTVFTGHPQKAGSPLSVVASIPHPAHVSVANIPKIEAMAELQLALRKQGRRSGTMDLMTFRIELKTEDGAPVATADTTCVFLR